MRNLSREASSLGHRGSPARGQSSLRKRTRAPRDGLDGPNSSAAPYASLSGGKDPGQVELAHRARQYIRHHFARPEGCRTAEIAHELKVSASHLCHRYRTVFGLTISQEIRKLRVHRARLLLERSNLLIKEVAAEAGYQQASYRTFLNAFRAETGMSPSTYQKLARHTGDGAHLRRPRAVRLRQLR